MTICLLSSASHEAPGGTFVWCFPDLLIRICFGFRYSDLGFSSTPIICSKMRYQKSKFEKTALFRVVSCHFLVVSSTFLVVSGMFLVFSAPFLNVFFAPTLVFRLKTHIRQSTIGN
jgi:hypothetical protein